MFRPELKEHLRAEHEATLGEAFAMLHAAIARCQDEGTIAPGDPRPLVLLAWSAVHGAVALELKGLVLTPDPEYTYRAFLTTLIRGLAPG